MIVHTPHSAVLAKNVIFVRKKLKVQRKCRKFYLLFYLYCGNPEYVPSSTLTSFFLLCRRLKQKIQFSLISVLN